MVDTFCQIDRSSGTTALSHLRRFLRLALAALYTPAGAATRTNEISSSIIFELACESSIMRLLGSEDSGQGQVVLESEDISELDKLEVDLDSSLDELDRDSLSSSQLELGSPGPQLVCWWWAQLQLEQLWSWWSV